MTTTDAAINEKEKPNHQEPADKKEKPPAQSWRYFLSMIRYSP